MALASFLATGEVQSADKPPDAPAAQLLEAAQLDQRVVALYQKGKHAEALPLAQRSLDIRQKLLGPDHLNTAMSLHNLASQYAELRDYAKAETLFLRALAIKTDKLGPGHPDTTSTVKNLAFMYIDQGGLDRAERLYKDTLGQVLNRQDVDESIKAMWLDKVVWILWRQDKFAEAEPLARQRLAMANSTPKTDYVALSRAHKNLAAQLVGLGRYLEALPHRLQEVTLVTKSYGNDSLETAISLNHLAVLYQLLGYYTKAESMFLQSLDIKYKHQGPTHPDTVASLTNLADLYREMGSL
ncbi:MAG: tetratricopeptide repeat protein [Caldilineaceae bacterium]|nr:tetratricopeptide repeat protein [Caldilineaceae bacterium]